MRECKSYLNICHADLIGISSLRELSHCNLPSHEGGGVTINPQHLTAAKEKPSTRTTSMPHNEYRRGDWDPPGGDTRSPDSCGEGRRQRLAAISALASNGETGACESLLMLLTNAEPEVRFTAADALGELRDLRAAETLRFLSMNDENCFVRVAARIALRKMTGEDLDCT